MRRITNIRSKWEIKPVTDEDKKIIDEIADSLSISIITAQLLYNRGMKTPSSAKAFLDRNNLLMYDPFLLRDMDKAVERICGAIKEGEKIAIYGDYDVDGVTAVSILYLYLKEHNANCIYYIPCRTGEGYGVNISAVDYLAGENVKLIITVDCGITAFEETEYAKKLGIDIVITDHHECHGKLPEAVAVVNCRRPDSDYPFRELAGVGVVFKTVCAVEYFLYGYEENHLFDLCKKYSDLVAIGTIADVMSLTDENRLFVTIGLENIEKNMRPGIKALIETVHPKDEINIKKQKTPKINTSFVGFIIAPRINAAGRLTNASRAVELFLSDDIESAFPIAADLCETNRLRQTEETKTIEEAYQMIESEFDFKNDKIIILTCDTWHHGVIGIVASRITERYNLPAILISFENSAVDSVSSDDIGKGSGRSIKGLNLVEALSSCSELLQKFGGHELAAGLSISRSKVEEFKRTMNEYAASHLTNEALTPIVPIDAVFNPSDLNINQAEELLKLEPFGVSNPTPVFALYNVLVSEIRPIGCNRHTKIIFSTGKTNVDAVCFGITPPYLNIFPGDYVDVSFNLDINNYQYVRSIQLIVIDIRLCDTQYEMYLENKRNYYDVKNCVVPIAPELIPVRSDFSDLYLYIKQENKRGFDIHNINSIAKNCSKQDIGYIKTRFIIDIFVETGLIEAQEISEDLYKIKINVLNDKVILEKSSIYKMLTLSNNNE